MPSPTRMAHPGPAQQPFSRVGGSPDGQSRSRRPRHGPPPPVSATAPGGARTGWRPALADRQDLGLRPVWAGPAARLLPPSRLPSNPRGTTGVAATRDRRLPLAAGRPPPAPYHKDDGEHRPRPRCRRRSGRRRARPPPRPRGRAGACGPARRTSGALRPPRRLTIAQGRAAGTATRIGLSHEAARRQLIGRGAEVNFATSIVDHAASANLAEQLAALHLQSLLQFAVGKLACLGPLQPAQHPLEAGTGGGEGQRGLVSCAKRRLRWFG
jgi:hypothetical protein